MMEQQMQPVTPRSQRGLGKRVRYNGNSDEHRDGDESFTDSSDHSPRKKPRAPRAPTTPNTPITPKSPKTPSRTEQKKTEAAKRKQWKADWEQWVVDSKWKKDPNYKQKEDTEEIHKTDAKTFYNLKTDELDTLPYWEFDNEHNPTHPGRSYPHDSVKQLAFRKHARLAGLHTQVTGERELLARGGKLFNDHQISRHEKNPKMPTKPKTFRMVRKRTHFGGAEYSRPGGSWETPIWENGRVIGHYLNYQFDPEDQGDYDFPEERWRPIGSDEWIKPLQ